MRLVGKASFGATVLTGRDEGGRTCSNGLPVVPASVRMLGRFQFLKSLDHPGLCHYIELIRCSLAQNSAILISEHFEQSLRDIILQIRHDCRTNIVIQVISALKYLHDHHICSGILRPNTVLCFQHKSNHIVRLSQYGICHVTDDGVDMIDPLYMEHGISPEQLLKKRTSKAFTTFKTDIWALGILLLELSTGVLLEKVWSINQYLAILETALLSSPVSLYSKLLETLRNSTKEAIQEPSSEIAEIIERCLRLLPSQRPTAHELLIELESVDKGHHVVPEVESIEEMTERVNVGGNDWKFTELGLDEAFFLWKLCGGSPENILVKYGVIKLQFPINTLPLLVVEDARLFGNEDGRTFRIKCNIFSLPDKNLREKLSYMDDDVFLHSVELDGIPEQSSSLSIIVKEKDVTYQISRMSIIRHLIEGRYFHNLLPLAVKGDVPPLVRGAVWSCLLGFKESYRLTFYNLDTLEPHSSDRQLDVDIPRCHQYEELMTSPAAHAQLRRIIKGWLLSHPEYVYWQGCDSLAAPFLLLNFNDPAVALNCMTAFIQKYLRNFFLKDNSDIIQEYLAVFNHLLAFVDSHLYSRLSDLDFYPELFAIPWFLTCFAHVLPLHKLFHVWDVLLLKDSSFPLFIGLAILRQLRHRLIEATFNDAILLFSDLPDLSMERVILDSLMYYERVPPSCAFRLHSDLESSLRTDEPGSIIPTFSKIGHQELKTWDCPRMSKEEFVWRVTHEQILVIDIRNQNDFHRGSVLRSLSYPTISDCSYQTIVGALKQAQKNNLPICVVGGKDVESTKTFTSTLVRNRFDGICVLDGGFEIVRDDRSIIGVH